MCSKFLQICSIFHVQDSDHYRDHYIERDLCPFLRRQVARINTNKKEQYSTALYSMVSVWLVLTCYRFWASYRSHARCWSLEQGAWAVNCSKIWLVPVPGASVQCPTSPPPAVLPSSSSSCASSSSSAAASATSSSASSFFFVFFFLFFGGWGWEVSFCIHDKYTLYWLTCLELEK